MKTVISRIDLGMTRIAGYTIYNSETFEFLEKTPKETKELIKKGEVNGLKLINGEIEMDKEEFNQRNLMIKTGVGKFRPLYENDSLVNCMYAVIRDIIYDDREVFEIINNRCARTEVSKEKLKVLMEIGYVAGVRFKDKNKIEPCRGVIIEDYREKKGDNEKKVSSLVKKKETSKTSNEKEKEKTVALESE